MGISIMVRRRESAPRTNLPFCFVQCRDGNPDGRVGAQHMKRHSHVQSGLAISDGRWVIDVSYNSGLDPCSR